ncbi:hypothetical protein LY90DRAFT_14685 [Neocallimastix californiae]|uniref:Uncharacterized protein n=1 Tax=Neocallimastix californiae TaxID=1754190 RepID=A0A1Y2CGM7_9FUNG|nr:hypothetical protein LY90DRAFT_14685 [Neocallimastix californiae]|eukprot:ORY46179.1 hypothetical protein LY90DRAFT_14685 [Neocallimastix californiae]
MVIVRLKYLIIKLYSFLFLFLFFIFYFKNKMQINKILYRKKKKCHFIYKFL